MTAVTAVTAQVQADGVLLTLPAVQVLVSRENARRLRDVLGAVLPEQIVDLMHDPRVADLEILRAAQAILAERGQDTENLGVAIDALQARASGTSRLHENVCPRCAGDGRSRLWDGTDSEPCSLCEGTGKALPRLHLLSIAGDVEPELSGAYDTERERLEAARDYRRAHGPEDGLFRVDVDATGTVTVDTFSGAELGPQPRRCVLCKCDATGEAYGFAVCDYHSDHSEDDPRCPHCAGKYTCERCENRHAEHVVRDVALCDRCNDVVQSVAIGDRVRDPMDGRWREIVGIDGLADGGSCHMKDGGCMSLAECAAADKRLPSESLDDDELLDDGRQLLREHRDMHS